MTGTVIIDIIVIGLLGVTIFYAYKLDRRLQAVRNTQNELAKVILELNTAAARAEAGIQGLKMAADQSGRQLDEKIKSARLASDELSNLLDSSQAVAQRIQTPTAPASTEAHWPRTKPSFDALRALSAR